MRLDEISNMQNFIWRRGFFRLMFNLNLWKFSLGLSAYRTSYKTSIIIFRFAVESYLMKAQYSMMYLFTNMKTQHLVNLWSNNNEMLWSSIHQVRLNPCLMKKINNAGTSIHASSLYNVGFNTKQDVYQFTPTFLWRTTRFVSTEIWSFCSTEYHFVSLSYIFFPGLGLDPWATLSLQLHAYIFLICYIKSIPSLSSQSFDREVDAVKLVLTTSLCPKMLWWETGKGD